MHYEKYGDRSAPLMVFLHGGGVSGWMWDKQIQYFSRHYHCIVPDLPGHGRSKGEETFSMKRCAEELIGLVEEAGKGKKVNVIGFSLGAQVTVEMLGIKPELVDTAIINSALVKPMSLRKWIKPTMALTFPLVKNRVFSKLQAKELYIGEEYFERYYEESCQMKQGTLISILEENMSFEIPDSFGKATARMLVTVGEKEKAIMKKSAMDLVKSNPRCTGMIIPNVGHGLSFAQPDYFNQMVEEWIHDESLPKEGKRIG